MLTNFFSKYPKNLLLEVGSLTANIDCSSTSCKCYQIELVDKFDLNNCLKIDPNQQMNLHLIPQNVLALLHLKAYLHNLELAYLLSKLFKIVSDILNQVLRLFVLIPYIFLKQHIHMHITLTQSLSQKSAYFDKRI